MVDLLVGVQMADVLLELHGVKGDEGAEVTAEPVAARVTVPPVLQEEGFIGAGEVTLRAVVGQVRSKMSLHVRLTLKNGPACMVTTLHRLDPVCFGGVSEKFFVQGTLERAAIDEAGRWFAIRLDVVRLHVSFKRPAQAKALPTGGAGVAVTTYVAFCLISVHADKVAADCVPFDGRILTQVALVNLCSRLTEHVNAQLALAGEVTLAGGTLETGLGEMQVEVLLQVRARLEAAPTRRAGVGTIDLLCTLSKVLYKTSSESVNIRLEAQFTLLLWV